MNLVATAQFPTRLFGANDETVAIEPLPTISGRGLQDAAPEACEGAPVSRDLRDEVLLDRVSQGDKESLGLLFRRYARMVRSVANKILRNAAEADDLVQEVFLFVFQKANLFDPARGSARTWLVQVAYHRTIDRRRSLTSRGFYAQVELEDMSLQVGEPEPAACSYEHTLEATLGPDALERIEACLSEVQRRVLDLRFAQGCTMEEIACLLGQSVGNVRNHYYRALERIRRELFRSEASGKGKGRVASG